MCPAAVSYEDCAVLVRFDEQDAQTYSASGPSDNSTDVIFLNDYSRFLRNMQQAQTVRISAEIYQEGSPVFEFDVRDFVPTNYQPQ